MKYFSQLVKEQEKEVQELKKIALSIAQEKIQPNGKIIGALLTGSVARGDARKGPFGIMIDIALVVNKKDDISLDELFGKDEEPNIPYHCIIIREKIGLGIVIIEEKDLYTIRAQPESVIFARNESIIIDDKKSILKKWKEEYFNITDEQIKTRALGCYFRFCYVTDRYHFEKWMYREALIQVAQNFNEAGECYSGFLYCINKMFIPRKDWLAYLTYEMKIKPEKHDSFMNSLFTSRLDKESILLKDKVMQEIKNWMEEYCKNRSWL